MRRTTPTGLGALALVIACLAALAPNALAGSNNLTPNGLIYSSGNWGVRHSLNEVNALSFSGGTCATALNDDGSGWAGSPNCAPAGQYAVHSYCACKLRRGFIYTVAGSTLSGIGQQLW